MPVMSGRQFRDSVGKPALVRISYMVKKRQDHLDHLPYLSDNAENITPWYYYLFGMKNATGCAYRFWQVDV
jgi:hypothetical protein